MTNPIELILKNTLVKQAFSLMEAKFSTVSKKAGPDRTFKNYL